MQGEHESDKMPASSSLHIEPDAAIPYETHPSGAWVGHPLSENERLEMFAAHRPRLLGIAYRMLGTASDAEDMLQETFIRWQQSSAIEIESPEAYLVTIITRLCLNYLQLARVKREEYFG